MPARITEADQVGHAVMAEIAFQVTARLREAAVQQALGFSAVFRHIDAGCVQRRPEHADAGGKPVEPCRLDGLHGGVADGALRRPAATRREAEHALELLARPVQMPADTLCAAGIACVVRPRRMGFAGACRGEIEQQRQDGMAVG